MIGGVNVYRYNLFSDMSYVDWLRQNHPEDVPNMEDDCS